MVRHKYLVIWLITATIVIAYILGNYYRELGFYYPKWYSDFLMNTFEPSDAEVADDLYIYSNFILSFVLSCIVASLFSVARKMMTKKQ